MSLPIDLVLLRHGQSEGNLAKRRSEAGDHSAYVETFRNRHTANLRLTDKGRQQAADAGAFIRREFFGVGFDRYLTSEYVRAVETAGLLALPHAQWYTDFYLTERDWGELDGCPEHERDTKFGDALRRRNVEPFFWRPPNGESFAQLCLRVDRVLDTLHRECSDKRVLIVCHGEVIRAFQVRIERLSQARFRELVFSTSREDRIHNGQVLHYTRRDPESGRLAPYAGWWKWSRPADSPPTTSGWHAISRSCYSNEQLTDLAAQSPPVIR